MCTRLEKTVFLKISYIAYALACSQKNTSCEDIKTKDGYKFKHGVPEGSEIHVIHNGTPIAYARLGNPASFKLSPQVLSMDNESVTTRNCQDTTIHSVVPDGIINGKQRVKDDCADFKILDTTDQMNSDPNNSTPPVTLISILGIMVILGIGIGIGIGVLCWCYQSWKQKQGEASLSQCLRYRGEGEKTRNEKCSDRDPRGSGENTEQDNTLNNVCVHSIDSKVDGNTPQSTNLDCNLGNERLQTTKNGDIGAYNASRVSHHRSMNRNLREDPGGANSNKGKDISELDTGGTIGNHHAEDHETEGQPLLSNQRAAILSFEMTGEAIPLVNKDSFDPDPVSRCMVAPEMDVESKSTT